MSIIKQLPGVTVHKSFKDAMASVSSDLEKQHLASLKTSKNESAKAKANMKAKTDAAKPR